MSITSQGGRGGGSLIGPRGASERTRPSSSGSGGQREEGRRTHVVPDEPVSPLLALSQGRLCKLDKRLPASSSLTEGSSAERLLARGAVEGSCVAVRVGVKVEGLSRVCVRVRVRMGESGQWEERGEGCEREHRKRCGWVGEWRCEGLRAGEARVGLDPLTAHRTCLPHSIGLGIRPSDRALDLSSAWTTVDRLPNSAPFSPLQPQPSSHVDPPHARTGWPQNRSNTASSSSPRSLRRRCPACAQPAAAAARSLARPPPAAAAPHRQQQPVLCDRLCCCCRGNRGRG